MPLLADRFLRREGHVTTDLATGQPVVLTISCAGDEHEQRRWVVRCETLQKLHHPAIARLVDYGAIGESQRFEAWRCDASGPAAGSTSEQSWARASAVLRACGLSEGSYAATWLRDSPSGAVLLPGPDAGYRVDDAHAAPVDSPRAIIVQPRRAVGVLGELFDPAAGPRPRIAALWGPSGAGKRTAVGELARVARLRGFVPVSARLVSRLADQLSGRSLFLIDDGEPGVGWKALVDATLASQRPHVLLFVGAQEVLSVDGLGMEPLSLDVLEGAVCPAATIPSDLFRIRRAAEQACGWPGRFARLLWGEGHGGVRAAERSVAYDVDVSVSPGRGAVRQPPGVAAGELAELTRRMESGVQLIESGRHARGERVLRQTVGALSRREHWNQAGEGSLALARMLVQRGRVRDAQTALRSAAEYWGRTVEEARLVDVAILSGTALMELGRIDAAETVFGAAAAAARSAGDLERLCRARTGLARVLFWRARYDEAEEILDSIGSTEGNLRLSVVAGRLGAAIAVGRRALDLAVSRAAEAVRRASESGDAHLAAEAAYGASFAHLAVGDLAAVERDVSSCVAAARTVREPLQAARSRLILAEAFRRSGRPAAALAMLNRISRLGSVLPTIVRARCDLLREVLSSSGSARDVVERHVASTGLKAMALYVPDADKTPRIQRFDPMIDDIVFILDVCQTSADERAILLEVCRRVRERVHAAAVAFVLVEGSVCQLLASEGDQLESRIAARVAAAGSTIAPHRSDNRIEAGAPIRYGGTTIGVLVARWTLGAPHELGQAASLLTAAAAACAPIVSAAVVRRDHASVRGTSELIGVSAAISDIRRAVDGAAPAPFAVLIEGESGCGKELVARALHRCGPRRERPFVTLNCAALPEDLVEAELFGHARGAFTGAVAERLGVFEEAHGGTLFLDEIGELSRRAQAKVLRVLQDGELRRLGENASRRIDVRTVSATNRDLRLEVAAGRFRQDLWYRLDVIRITVPPLRDRREDIATLAEHFWRESALRVGSRATLTAATVAALARYDWPGNVRELQNVLASLVVRSPKRGVVPPTALGPQFIERRFAEASRLEDARRTFEERFIRAALVRTGGRRTWAARELGVTRQGLTKLMTRLGIATDPRDEAPDLKEDQGDDPAETR